MAPTRFRLLLTMDCERVRQHEFHPAGPRSWAESEANIAAFAGVATEHGFRATFFAVPEAVEAHAGLFGDLIAAGHEVGLHLHPNSFRYGVNEYLGNLPADVQRSILQEARDAFERAMGFSPTSFRPGHFSANADTFGVLTSLGFKRGSSAIPGRHLAGTGSDWRSWTRQCQYVGSFFDVPVTVHRITARTWRTHAARHVLALATRGFTEDAVRGAVRMLRGGRTGAEDDGILVDLRIEESSYGLIRDIIAAEVSRLTGHPHLPVITAVTHSYVNFMPDDTGRREHGLSRRPHLTRMLCDFKTGAAVFESRTLSELQQEFDRLSA